MPARALRPCDILFILSAFRSKTINARKGIKTRIQSILDLGYSDLSKTINARKGIKTHPVWLYTADTTASKTINARKGIKTSYGCDVFPVLPA